MHYGEVGQGGYDHSLGRYYMEHGIKFYRLIVALSDLSIHEALLYSRELETDTDGIMPFDWSLVKHHRRNASRKDTVDNQDDLITPDGLNAVDSPKSKTPLQAPQWTLTQDQPFWHNSLDYDLLYDVLTSTNGIEGKADQFMDIQTVADHVEQMLSDGTEVSQLPLGTM